MKHRKATSESTIATLRRLLGLMRRQTPWLLGGAALSLLSTLAGIGLMAVSGRFITAMALAGLSDAAINYYTPAALIRLFAILRTGGRYAERLVTHEATLRALSGVRIWLFERLVPLAPARLGALRSAQLFARLRADVDALEQAYLAILVPVAVAILASLVVWATMLAYLPVLAAAVGILMLFAGALVPAWIVRAGARPGADVVAADEALRALAMDGVLGRAELALYGAEAAHAEHMRRLTRTQQSARRRVDRLQAIGGASVTLAMQWTVVAALALGIPALRSGALRGPDLAMLVLLGQAGFEALSSLPDAWAQLGSTLASARRIFALADTEPALRDPVAPAMPPSGNDLCLRDVRLRYHDTGPWVLDGIDLDLPAGRHLALVGASGAGKSSLVHALTRLYPHQGSITLGGTALEALSGEAVRARIAVVDQRPYLFHASLRDNLLLARPEASDEDLNAAITQARLDDCVSRLPQGLDTHLGEDGARVSGGEARRIAIARALLADAPILVLDEPTEGLDATTAAALYQALAQAMRGRSVLLITHRLGGLSALVDEIVELAHGRVVDRRAPVSGHRPAQQPSTN
ncbi:thiol reductant ABC exporter subunit CydC [Oleiagrimonas sp.]|jgi:ATP-binding cassette subfamily C protein CydC|uniref:thiol reductant ABC exporter subunit CydC n=1 Tax=Oleiagrimonas sp. TaxID=2010330 RepID=UPI00260731F3|nr:thiol reductant ABC exporter subunit CydC [Oleiagrimonas sp.]MDA3913625.1 thiol reductant ABC exporter subunit CydC [Oleiagrimonas sp.]